MRRRSFWVLGAHKTTIGLVLGVVFAFSVQAQLGPPPRINVQPSGVAVSQGGVATFQVTVSASTVITLPTYAWRRNGQEIGNGTTVLSTNSLIINNVQSSDAGTYSVEVKNAAGKVISSNAVLLVLTEPVVPTPLVLTPGLTTNGFHLRLSGPAGSNYVIQASSDLSNWSAISTNAAPNGTAEFTDTTALSRTLRFYRAFVQ